jgi:hypothetical protein
VSLLLLYSRVFWVHRRTRILAYGGIAFIALFYLGLFAANLAYCVPNASTSAYLRSLLSAVYAAVAVSMGSASAAGPATPGNSTLTLGGSRMAGAGARAGAGAGALGALGGAGGPRGGRAFAQLIRCSRERSALLWTQAIFSLVSDLFVLTLPMQPVWQLQLPLRRKVAVSALFMAGLLYVSLIFLPLFLIFLFLSAIAPSSPP